MHGKSIEIIKNMSQLEACKGESDQRVFWNENWSLRRQEQNCWKEKAKLEKNGTSFWLFNCEMPKFVKERHVRGKVIVMMI